MLPAGRRFPPFVAVGHPVVFGPFRPRAPHATEPPFALASTKVKTLCVSLREPSVGVPAAPEESPDREVRIIFVVDVQVPT